MKLPKLFAFSSAHTPRTTNISVNFYENSLGKSEAIDKHYLIS